MSVQQWAWLAIGVGFALCAVLARVIYVEDRRDRAPASRRGR